MAALHVHTKYSEKDASATSEKYVNFIKKYNKDSTDAKITALAITDHGNMSGIVQHDIACSTPDDDGVTVKPITGCEVYHTRKRADETKDRFHLVLLAKTQEGLKNLYNIVSDGGLNPVKGRSKAFPITEENTFKEYGKGIVALSACIGGIIPQLILDGEYDKAKEKALEYRGYFDDFYLEVQPHEIPEQLLVNSDLVRMSKETGIPLVITSDAHYIKPEDKEYHDILKKMAFHRPFDVDCHFRTPEEVEEYCNKYDIPLECIDNTVKIAEMCNTNPKPTDRRGLLPEFPCPTGYNDESYLRELAYNKLMKFIKIKEIKDIEKYTKQLTYELDVICSAGFASYFLILWDWFAWCRKNKILMGPGRGKLRASY